MTDKDHCNRFEPEELAKTMGELFLTAEEDAKLFSHEHRTPYWRALPAIWFRKTRKRRTALELQLSSQPYAVPSVSLPSSSVSTGSRPPPISQSRMIV